MFSAIAGNSGKQLRLLKISALLVGCSMTFVFFVRQYSGAYTAARENQWQHPLPLKSENVALVVASQLQDNTTWLRDTFSDWNQIIFVTDDVGAEYTVPVNKGREGMVYLTYIIENYDDLAEVVVFQHSKQYQWHNDDPLYDGERVLKRLQLPYIRQQGYVNLRCVWTLGCPAEIHPFDEEVHAGSSSDDVKAGSFYKTAFEHLFPNLPVPRDIGVSCCAQFAVTAETIRRRPLSDYVSYRQWLMDTDLHDDLSGRIMEYSWHIIFGKEPVFCPNAAECYCKVFGLCEIECQQEGVCESQYVLPPYSVMPDAWPSLGWEGEEQNVAQLRVEQELDYAPRPA